MTNIITRDAGEVAPVLPERPFDVVAADIAHAQFMAICRQPPNMAVYETAETAFLFTPADTADGINRKLALAESYMDETDCCSPGDLESVRLVMALVRKGELESAMRYSRAILDGDAEEFCLTPIRAAIADMERMEATQ